MARDLESEKGKTDTLLREMLPASVATALISGCSVDPREYPEASVLFADLPAFQSIVPFCQPKGIVLLLNNLFTSFDRLVTLNNVKVHEMPDYSRLKPDRLQREKVSILRYFWVSTGVEAIRIGGLEGRFMK
jgi:hypothetical protein